MSPNLRLHFSPASSKLKTTIWRSIAFVTSLVISISSFALQSQQPPPVASPDNSQIAANGSTAVTVPAGTTIALVLTQPVQTRHLHRGDDIYAQIVSPVTAGNEAVIPPGTFVQGKFDKLERKSGRGELRLQSMSITFPDGYVTPIAGPMTLESSDGYALKDPGSGRLAGLIAAPAAGVGLGALIGHSLASSQGSTITSTNPPGCMPGSFDCLSSSVTGPPDKGKDTVIGAAVGGGVGFAIGFLLAGTSHHFFLDVGTPVEMVLQHPISLKQDEVALAIHDAERHPAPEQPVAPRPVLTPPPDDNSGICWTPGTPGTPGTDIPGTPAINGSPGTPAIHIPGTPGTPPTARPCP